MSRSIHETRRSAFRAGRPFDVVARSLRRYFLKQRTKRMVRRERRGAEVEKRSGIVPQSPATVPIRYLDQGKNIHYLLSEQEVRDVLARLPAGLVTGVSAIQFELGIHVQEQEFGKVADRLPLTRDPWFQRLSVAPDDIGGLYRPNLLGTYSQRSNLIRIFAYVGDGDHLSPAAVMAHKRQMLHTLLHEMAHHDDWRCRVARGRWTMDDISRAEAYANERAARWMQDCVAVFEARGENSPPGSGA